jgi:anti-anti-sigma factor
MSVQYARPPAVVRVAISGDGAACRTAIDRLAEQHAGRPVHLVVGLDGGQGGDSLLLGALVLASKRLERDGGGLELASGRRDVRRLLGVTGLDRVLPLAEPR